MLISDNKIPCNKFSVPGTAVFSDGVFLLKGVSFGYVYDAEGNPTKEIEAVKYSCVDTNTYSYVTVKVPGKVPLIDPKLFAANEDNDDVFVEFPLEAMLVKPYRAEKGQLFLTITAPSVALVNN